MSERTSNRRTRRGSRRSQLPAGRQSLFDALWQEILTRIETGDDARAMTLGNVVGARDGGKVRVRVDDEDEDRTIGFASAQGTNYQPGDRVALGKNRAGEYVLLGNLAPRDKSVTQNQLYGNSVGTPELIPKSVTNAILDDNLSGKIKDAITNSDLNNKLTNYAKSSDLSNYAKASALTSLQTATKNALTKLERRIEKLEKSKTKKDPNKPPSGS